MAQLSCLLHVVSLCGGYLAQLPRNFWRISWVDAPLHWANLGILFTAALLPFPTSVLSHALTRENVADARTALAFYALVGMLLCVSWFVLFHYLVGRPHLSEEDVNADFLRRERTRVAIGVVLYPTAGFLGVAFSPILGLVIFLLLTVFYGATTQGLDDRPRLLRRST